MKTYAGIDLHSSNNFIGIIDAKDRRLSKRHDNRIEDVLKAAASTISHVYRNRRSQNAFIGYIGPTF